MESEIRTACHKAVAKMAVGLSLIVALLGFRIVSVASKDSASASASEQLERLDLEFADEIAGTKAAAEPIETSPNKSLLSRSNLVQTAKALAKDPIAQVGDRLVSCSFESSMQFMRANDCAMRGGRSVELTSER